MTAICECNHHKWCHYSYYNDLKEGENDNCMKETCRCVAYTPRQFSLDDRHYPCKEALAVRLAHDGDLIHGRMSRINEYYRYFRNQCPICHNYYSNHQQEEYRLHLAAHRRGLESQLENKLEDLVARYALLKENDKREREQEEQIRLKPHQTCKMFRCLKCWKLILPDDDMQEFGDGYVHKICLHIVHRNRSYSKKYNKTKRVRAGLEVTHK